MRIKSIPFAYVVALPLVSVFGSAFVFFAMRAAGHGVNPAWGVASAGWFALAVGCVSIWAKRKGTLRGSWAFGFGVATLALSLARVAAEFAAQHVAIPAFF